jgi:hypothetical protein
MPRYETQDITSEQVQLLGDTALVTQATDPDLLRAQAIYEQEETLHAPSDWAD